jgi:hypothetical protein
VPKDPRTSHASDSTFVAPRTTHSGGASSASSTNSSFMNMFRGIFVMCWCTDQCLDVMEQRLQIVRSNQEIIHNQRDEPLQEFPDIPAFPYVPNPYGSLTPAKLAAFGIGPARISSDDDDEAHANDDEETEDDEEPASLLCFIALFSLFGVLTTKGEKRVISISVFLSSVVCNMDKDFLYVWLVIL